MKVLRYLGYIILGYISLGVVFNILNVIEPLLKPLSSLIAIAFTIYILLKLLHKRRYEELMIEILKFMLSLYLVGFFYLHSPIILLIILPLCLLHVPKLLGYVPVSVKYEGENLQIDGDIRSLTIIPAYPTEVHIEYNTLGTLRKMLRGETTLRKKFPQLRAKYTKTFYLPNMSSIGELLTYLENVHGVWVVASAEKLSRQEAVYTLHLGAMCKSDLEKNVPSQTSEKMSLSPPWPKEEVVIPPLRCRGIHMNIKGIKLPIYRSKAIILDEERKMLQDILRTHLEFGELLINKQLSDFILPLIHGEKVHIKRSREFLHIYRARGIRPTLVISNRDEELEPLLIVNSIPEIENISIVLCPPHRVREVSHLVGISPTSPLTLFLSQNSGGLVSLHGGGYDEIGYH